MTDRIKQIVPANDGWYAKFRQSGGEITYNRVAVWAIVSDQNGERVVGISESDVFDADDICSNFCGYQYGTD